VNTSWLPVVVTEAGRTEGRKIEQSDSSLAELRLYEGLCGGAKDAPASRGDRRYIITRTAHSGALIVSGMGCRCSVVTERPSAI
jgi:hypothetical protein